MKKEKVLEELKFAKLELNEAETVYNKKLKNLQAKCDHLEKSVHYTNDSDGYSICMCTSTKIEKCDICGKTWETKTQFMGP